jgi:hypothetical protein
MAITDYTEPPFPVYKPPNVTRGINPVLSTSLEVLKVGFLVILV